MPLTAASFFGLNTGDWTTVISSALSVFLLWQQNRIFQRQNEIFASQAGIAALPSKTTLAVRFNRYWPTIIMVVLILAIAYDYYDRHANVSPAPVSKWHYALIVLIILSVTGLTIAKPVRTQAASVDTTPTGNSREPSKLVIHRAVYAAGLQTEVSVTDKLQNIVRDGIAITVDGTLGSLIPDPAYGVCKRLDVEYSYGSDTRFRLSRWERPAGEIMRLVLPEDTEVKRLASEVQRLTPAAPKIVKLSDRIEHEETATYPLKLRMHLRNESTFTVDLQLQEYRPELITLMGFPTEVFQIRLRDSWYPKAHGTGRIALYPGQQFEAWIAPDIGKFTKAQVEGHRGRIGTLVLLVNGQNVEIKL